MIWGKLWSRSVKSMCSALDPSWGNLHRDDQAGQKSPSHTPGATFKRTETVPPDVSWVAEGNKALLLNFRLGKK